MFIIGDVYNVSLKTFPKMKERFGFGNCLYFGHLAIDILPAILFYYKK